MTSLIERLWLADELPIRDGLYRADGASCDVEVAASVAGNLKILSPFSLEDFLSQDPEMRRTSIATTLIKSLPNDAGYVFCGEGSYGSEGFFGRIDQRKNLMWVVYLEHSNPFIDASISDIGVTFTSSLEVSITVDLEASEFRVCG